VRFGKVVCIYPYFREVPIYEFFPPIGLEYIAAAVEDLVDDVSVVDLRFEKDLHGILRNGADMFCVSVNWHYEFHSVCELIRALPKDATTVVGGRHATANVQQLFDSCPNIDIIVRGDGEETMREFVTSGSPENIEGLSYRRNGKVIHNANRNLNAVSNTLFPNREARRYRYRISYQKVGLGYGVDSIVSSRGCPFGCRFCSFDRNPLGQRRTYSERTPESVLAELRRIRAKVIAFLDDNFFVNLKRAEEICDLIIEEKLNKKLIVNARVSIGFQPRLLAKMYRAGFRLLMIGIESAQDKSLKSLDKGFTTADVRNAFKEIRRSNMLTSGYFIVGIIGETNEDMTEIASFAQEIGLDLIHLNRLRFERYSGLGDLIEQNNDYYVGDRSRVYSEAYGPKEMLTILKRIRKEFFTYRKLVAIAFKAMRIGFPGWRFFLRMPIVLPRVAIRLLRRKKRRQQARRALQLAVTSYPRQKPVSHGL